MIFFFFNDTATTEIYTLSLHDALPIWLRHLHPAAHCRQGRRGGLPPAVPHRQERRQHRGHLRSEEHTSELQSRQYLVCRLLLEKKNNLDPPIFQSEHNTA